MKKTLVALATFSAICSASADVDVSGGIKLYGVVDQAVTTQQLVNPATLATNAGSTLNYTSLFAASATSRLGVKGERDLGEGSKGFIQAELQIEPDNAALLNSTKNRTALVGISNPTAGSISLGTMETTAYEIFGMDVNGRVEYKPQVWRTVASEDVQDRANNSVKYITPSINGFTGHVHYGLSDKRVGATPFAALGFKYKSERLTGAFVYDSLYNAAASYRFAGVVNAGPSAESINAQSQGGTAGSLPSNQSSDKLIYGGAAGVSTVKRQIGALTYAFDAFSVNYIYAKSYVINTGTQGSDTTNTFGIKIPYEKFVFAGSYGTGNVNSFKSAATLKYVIGSAKISDTTIGVYYNFDKSTSFYFLNSVSKFDGIAGNNLSNQDGKNVTYAVGARYNF